MKDKITKEEFILKNASLIKNEIGNFATTKFQGKRYQDEILALMLGSTVSLPYQRQLSEVNKNNTLIELLKDSLVIDEELYQFLIEKKKHYIQTKPGSGSSGLEFATWVKTLHEQINNDKQISKFSRTRVQDNIERSYEEQLQIIREMEDNYLKIKTLLKKKTKRSNKKDKALLTKEMTEKDEELQIEYNRLADIYDKKNNTEYEHQQVRLFAIKIRTLLSNYISSWNHADENLRKKYIELFLLDKIKSGVEFKIGEDYSLEFGKKIEKVVDENNSHLLRVLNKYEDEKTYTQGKFDFGE